MYIMLEKIVEFIFKRNLKLKFIIFLELLLFLLIIFNPHQIFAQVVYKEYDTNGDGKIDRWVWLYNGFVQKVILDLNFDGLPDAEYRYIVTDNGSIPQFQQFDTNFDGKYDDFYFSKMVNLSGRKLTQISMGKLI